MINEEIFKKDEYKENGLSQDSNSSNRYEYSENWTQNSTNKKNIVDTNESATKPKITKFFIGGVPPYMNRVELASLFQTSANKGNLPSCRLVEAACHQGFGFVELEKLYKKDEQIYLNNLKIHHKTKKFDVRLAVDSKDAKENIEKNKEKKLLVSNITKKITHVELRNYFSKFGKIENAYVGFNPVTGQHKGIGFVIFEDLDNARDVLKTKFHEINGVKATVTRNLLKNEYKNLREKRTQEKDGQSTTEKNCDLSNQQDSKADLANQNDSNQFYQDNYSKPSKNHTATQSKNSKQKNYAKNNAKDTNQDNNCNAYYNENNYYPNANNNQYNNQNINGSNYQGKSRPGKGNKSKANVLKEEYKQQLKNIQNSQAMLIKQQEYLAKQAYQISNLLANEDDNTSNDG